MLINFEVDCHFWFTWFSAVQSPTDNESVTLGHITTRGILSMMFRTRIICEVPLSRVPINDLDSKVSVQIIIFDLLLRCRNVCERSMPQSDGLCHSTKPPCILSTFSDPGP